MVHLLISSGEGDVPVAFLPTLHQLSHRLFQRPPLIRSKLWCVREGGFQFKEVYCVS